MSSSYFNYCVDLKKPGSRPGHNYTAVSTGKHETIRIASPELMDRYTIAQELPLFIEAEDYVRSGDYRLEHAERMFGWTTQLSRQNIDAACRMRNMFAANNEGITQEDHLAYEGLCGGYSYSVGQILDSLGIENYKKNIELFTGSRIRHSFTVAHIDSKDAKSKAYLIDQTLLQFLPHDDLRYLQPENNPDKPFQHLAHHFKQSPGSLDLAQEIIRKGYCEATDENIALYLKPFISMAQELLPEERKLTVTESLQEQKNLILGRLSRRTSDGDLQNAYEPATPKVFYGLV